MVIWLSMHRVEGDAGWLSNQGSTQCLGAEGIACNSAQHQDLVIVLCAKRAAWSTRHLTDVTCCTWIYRCGRRCGI